MIAIKFRLLTERNLWRVQRSGRLPCVMVCWFQVEEDRPEALLPKLSTRRWGLSRDAARPFAAAPLGVADTPDGCTHGWLHRLK